MRKILTEEVFYFKDTTGNPITADNFIKNLKKVGNANPAILATIKAELIKATKLPAKEITKSLNNIISSYINTKGQDYFQKILDKLGWAGFIDFFIKDIKVFIDKLPENKEDSLDGYGSQRGWDSGTTDKMNDYWAKINTSITGPGSITNLNPTEAIDFVNTLLGKPTRMDQDAAERFIRTLRDIYKGPGGVTETKLKDLFKSYSL